MPSLNDLEQVQGPSIESSVNLQQEEVQDQAQEEEIAPIVRFPQQSTRVLRSHTRMLQSMLQSTTEDDQV